MAIAAVLALVGITFLATSNAATYGVAVEAEDGALTGSALVETEDGASGNKVVGFGVGTGSVDCNAAGIQKIVDSVSPSTIEANLRKLVQDDSKPTPNQLISRHVSSPGNKIKTDWARQQYVGYGMQDVSQDFVSDGRQLTNVIARLPGSAANGKTYAAAGHIDSISENETAVAPGANDDGSGVIAAMEAARVLKAFQPCLKSTIEFIGFNDEEEGMRGSEVYAASMKGKPFGGLYNLDMLGSQDGGESCTYLHYNNATRDRPLADRMAAASATYAAGLKTPIESYDDDDQDAVKLWDANLPAVYVVECEFNEAYYHRTNDTVEHVSIAQVTATTKALVGALAELASQ